MKRILRLVTFLSTGVATLTAATLTGFTPIVGEPGVQVTISGSGLATATEVRFEDTVADFTAVDNNRIVAVVPLEAMTGPIRVKFPPSTTLNTSSSFTVAPRITEFSPTRGATNTTVLIYGANLLSVTNVQIAGLAASFHVNSAMQVTATVPSAATNGLVGPIRVGSPAGIAISTNDFLVMGRAPFVDGFSQDVAAPGTVIQVLGANFVGATRVAFSNQTATFTVSSASQINATVPATPMIGLVSVVNPGGTGVCSQPFRITRVPVITNFFPEFGKPGVTRVTLEGINFTDVTGVGFNGVRAAIEGSSANQIIVTVPATATSGRISATNASGSGVSSRDFVATRAPILDNYFEPPEGAPGRRVAIWGANLLDTRAVLFNGKNAAWFAASSDMQVNADVPAGATTGPITVTNNFGSATTTNDFVVSGSVSLPTVTALTPSAGPRGLAVMINGSHFTNLVNVKFNGVTAAGAVATSLSQINATVPAGATTGPLTVTTVAGTSTNTRVFYASPRLTGFTPTNGIVGDSVIVSGTNFTGATAVSIGDGSAAFTVDSTNRITAVIPTDATTGPVRVLAPGGAIASTNVFQVLPHITDFSPGLGPAGTVVHIQGTSFLNVSRVAFGAEAAAFTNASSTEVTAVVPNQPGRWPISVTTPDGMAVSSNIFLITAASDLSLSLTASSSLLPPNATVGYTIQVRNHGPAAASQVRVTNTLPAGMVFESASSDRGDCTFTNQVVRCELAVLDRDETMTITLQGRFPNEGTYVNTASVTSFEGDTQPGNNSASVSTVVVSDDSRALSIAASPGIPQVLISWPTSAVPFRLQSVSSLSSSNAWAQLTNTPAVVNGRNRVTNPAAGSSRFYRLSWP